MIQDVSAVLIDLADLIFVFAFCVFPCVFPCVSLKRASTRLKNNGRSQSGIQGRSHWMLEIKSSTKGANDNHFETEDIIPGKKLRSRYQQSSIGMSIAMSIAEKTFKLVDLNIATPSWPLLP